MFDSLNYGETVMAILNQWFQVVVYQVKSQIVFTWAYMHLLIFNFE